MFVRLPDSASVRLALKRRRGDGGHQITPRSRQVLPCAAADTDPAVGAGPAHGESADRQSLRSRTRRTEWSLAFCSTSRARERVGAMLSRRLGPLTAAQMPSAVSRGLLVGQRGEAVEVGAGVLERRAAQGEEPLDVPALDVGLGGVDVDREVEEVRQEDLGRGAVGPPPACRTLRPSTMRMSGRSTACRSPGRCRRTGGRRRARTPSRGRTSRRRGSASARGGRSSPGSPCGPSGRAPRGRRWAAGSRRWSPGRRGVSPAPAASRVCSRRAVVLLPTATLPATPMTNGTFAVVLPRNSPARPTAGGWRRRAGRAARPAAGRRSRPRRGRSGRRGWPVPGSSASSRGSREPAASARHEARSNTA